MSLHAVVLVPAAAWLLRDPELGVPDALAETVALQREDVHEAVDTLAGCDVVILVAPGTPGIVSSCPLSLAPLGIADAAPPTYRAPAFDVGPALQLVPRQLDAPDPEVLVLARHVHAVAPDAQLIIVAVDPFMPNSRAAILGRAIARWAAASGSTIGVIGNGDLAATHDATSPGHKVAGAAEFDAHLDDVLWGAAAADDAILSTAKDHLVRGLASIEICSQAVKAAGLRSIVHPRTDVIAGVGQLVAAAGVAGVAP